MKKKQNMTNSLENLLRQCQKEFITKDMFKKLHDKFKVKLWNEKLLSLPLTSTNIYISKQTEIKIKISKF